jgi:hypothetical protein
MANTKKSASDEGCDKGAVDLVIYICICIIDTTNYIYIAVMNNGSDLLTMIGLYLELDNVCVKEVGFKDLN